MRKFAEFWILAAAVGGLLLLSDRMRGGVIDDRAAQCLGLFVIFAGPWRIITAKRGLEFLWDEFAAGCMLSAAYLAAWFVLGPNGSHGSPPPKCLFWVLFGGAAFVGFEVLGAWLTRRRDKLAACPRR